MSLEEAAACSLERSQSLGTMVRDRRMKTGEERRNKIKAEEIEERKKLFLQVSDLILGLGCESLG